MHTEIPFAVLGCVLFLGEIGIAAPGREEACSKCAGNILGYSR